MEYKNNLPDRLLQFAVDVILYLRTVKSTSETMDMKRQLVNASTSSGANYEEAQGAVTKPDEKTKISISLKEIREAGFFLRVFLRLHAGDVKKCEKLVAESVELKKILGSILNKFLSILLPLGLVTWGLRLVTCVFPRTRSSTG
ncbi:MAG: four helix bundle protein [Bacteroidetes bacterium]|nr:four helix bundle protein [Bacteroidota bacterium]